MKQPPTSLSPVAIPPSLLPAPPPPPHTQDNNGENDDNELKKWSQLSGSYKWSLIHTWATGAFADLREFCDCHGLDYPSILQAFQTRKLMSNKDKSENKDRQAGKLLGKDIHKTSSITTSCDLTLKALIDAVFQQVVTCDSLDIETLLFLADKVSIIRERYGNQFYRGIEQQALVPAELIGESVEQSTVISPLALQLLKAKFGTVAKLAVQKTEQEEMVG